MLKKFIGVVLFLFAVGVHASNQLTDDAIAKKLIQNSINNYSGNCACPYNQTRNGSRCGKRSAYSKPGGYSPLCYRKDVTDSMIQRWKKKNL